MKKQINGVTEKMLKSVDSLSDKEILDLANKLGVKVVDSKLYIPDRLFQIFKPRVLGKFLGGLCLVLVGDLIYQSVAKKIVEKYPEHESKVETGMKVVSIVDLFIRPSWFKFGSFAWSNADKFKAGFDDGCKRAVDIGSYIKEMAKNMVNRGENN